MNSGREERERRSRARLRRQTETGHARWPHRRAGERLAGTHSGRLKRRIDFSLRKTNGAVFLPTAWRGGLREVAGQSWLPTQKPKPRLDGLVNVQSCFKCPRRGGLLISQSDLFLILCPVLITTRLPGRAHGAHGAMQAGAPATARLVGLDKHLTSLGLVCAVGRL